METSVQLVDMIRAFYNNDKDLFFKTALQIADQEAQSGHGAIAHEIKRLLKNSKAQVNPSITYEKTLKDILDEISIVLKPEERLGELIQNVQLKNDLKYLLHEYRERAKILAHGLSPRRKILLRGASGTGKSLTARIIAGELHLPLYTIFIDKIVTDAASAKLKELFTVIHKNRGVYFFDYFHAIGLEHYMNHDIRATNYVLHIFLQLLEQDRSDSIILVATNADKSLDRAILQRFDDILDFTLPDTASIEELLLNRLVGYWENTPYMQSLVRVAMGLTHAEITQACNNVIKYAILNNQKRVEDLSIQEAIAAIQSKYAR
ncbi:MAG: AAA family ATPase [Desulfovibrionaceae bacterium]|nr:AAA family ATPase [Desulfovibrionaceae bacterium]